jgi:hypothetical protein
MQLLLADARVRLDAVTGSYCINPIQIKEIGEEKSRLTIDTLIGDRTMCPDFVCARSIEFRIQ